MKLSPSLSSSLALGALAALFLVSAAPAAVAETVWTCGGINPPKATVSIASEKFAEWVNERLKGKLKINYFGGSKLGSGPAQLEAIATGAQQCYISSTSASSTLLTEWGVVDTPFLFNSMEHYLKFMNSDIAAELNDRMAKEFDARMISTNWFRLPRVFLGRNKFMRTPDDLKGIRVRAPNLPMWLAGWEAMGAIPVKTNYGEAYLAMSQGLVDGGESAGEQLFSSKFFEVLPYVVETQFLFPTNSVVVSHSALMKLDPATRTELIQIANEAGDFYSKLNADREAPERVMMKKQGAMFTGLSDTDRKKWVELVEKSVPSFESKGLLAKGLWQRIQALDK